MSKVIAALDVVNILGCTACPSFLTQSHSALEHLLPLRTLTILPLIPICPSMTMLQTLTVDLDRQHRQKESER
jgi:hypothetical protein